MFDERMSEFRATQNISNVFILTKKNNVFTLQDGPHYAKQFPSHTPILKIPAQPCPSSALLFATGHRSMEVHPDEKKTGRSGRGSKWQTGITDAELRYAGVGVPEIVGVGAVREGLVGRFLRRLRHQKEGKV